jgi:hypothetical protein
MAFIEKAVIKKSMRLLWGETIFSNVTRYVELYFNPVLEQLPKSMWDWNGKLMQMRISNSIIDFRSADNPDNWEGFGYDLIFLNEAGIILRNKDLYKKTVLPMMLDYSDSQLIAAGVPKGKKLKDGTPHPFYELWEKAANNPMYARYRYASHTNVYLNRENIAEIEEALDDNMRQQEIYGHFIDVTDSPFLYSFEPGTHITKQAELNPNQPIWLSFDFNVNPNSCLVGQRNINKSGGVIVEEYSVTGSTADVCDRINAKYAHWLQRGMVFVTGDATGNSRNSISGQLTNYMVIKQKLKLPDSAFKVRTKNIELSASQVICNGVLSRLDVKILASCHQTISDCQSAETDTKGELVKVNGLHKFDCFRYMIDAWFPDFLSRKQ